MPSLAYVLLGLGQAAGLLLLPVWTGGLWLQLGSLALFAWATDFGLVGEIPLLILLAIAVLVEVVEPTLAGGRIDPRSRRAGGTASLVGAAAGSGAGIVLPLLGTLFGAFAGALAAAGLAAATRATPRRGAVDTVGLAFAFAVRATAAVAIAAFALHTLGA